MNKRQKFKAEKHCRNNRKTAELSINILILGYKKEWFLHSLYFIHRKDLDFMKYRTFLSAKPFKI